MRVNEHTVISTNRVTLVPYEVRHVAKYHGWMSDPDIQAATASEPLTLEEEYENQASWRTSHDKLTFIICEPLPGAEAEVGSGTADREEAMIGDVNFFLYPYDDEDADDKEKDFVGEINVMVAEKGHRGRGVGFDAVTAMMVYVYRNLDAILGEHLRGSHEGGEKASVIDAAAGAEREKAGGRLRGLMAKIQKSNDKSVALFERVGFRQRGGVNYFGEVEMVLDDFFGLTAGSPAVPTLGATRDDDHKLSWRREVEEVYREATYSRPFAG